MCESLDAFRSAPGRTKLGFFAVKRVQDSLTFHPLQEFDPQDKQVNLFFSPWGSAPHDCTTPFARLDEFCVRGSQFPDITSGMAAAQFPHVHQAQMEAKSRASALSASQTEPRFIVEHGRACFAGRV